LASGDPITLGISLIRAGGITFDRNFTTLVTGDSYNAKGPAIEFWKPAGHEPVHAIYGSWIGSPAGFAYASTDKYLWDVDVDFATANEFTPGKGTPLDSITNAGNGMTLAAPNDVAVSPPDHP
jgi:hypothetical protein